MSQSSRREVLARLRQRYRGRGKQGRSQLVTEACELCGNWSATSGWTPRRKPRDSTCSTPDSGKHPAQLLLPGDEIGEQERDGGHVTRRYDAAQTPCQRLIASGKLPAAKQRELEQTLAKLNPFALKQELECNLAAVLRHPPLVGVIEL